MAPSAPARPDVYKRQVYGGTRGCISTVVTNSTALAKADYILLEGGVNDAWNNAPVGTLTDGFAAAYDETTMTGALEKLSLIHI